MVAILAIALSERVALAQTTWIGTAPATWDLDANWSASKPAIGVLAVFGNAGAGTITLDANQSALGLLFGNTSGSYDIENGTGTNLLTLGASGITTASGSPTVIINANVALGIGQTWAINGTGLTFGGIISNTSSGFGLTKTGAGALTLTGANTYDGATVLQGGTTTLGGSNGSIATSSGVTLGGGILILDNSANSNSDRVAGNLNLGYSSEFQLIGNGATSSVTEAIGTLVIGAGNSTVTVTGNGAGQLQQITAADISRTNNGTALIRGVGLGGAAGTNVTRVTINNLTALNSVVVGTNSASGGPGSIKDLKVVPYLYADTGGTGTGTGFATYDSTRGLRPLVANETVTLTAGYVTAANPENVRIANVTLLNSIIVNSFTTQSGTIRGSSTTITIRSGAIFGVSNNQTIGDSAGASPISGIILENGEGVINVAGGTLTLYSPISVTGSGSLGLTKGGAATLIVTGPYTSSTYSGPTTINAGVIYFGSVTGALIGNGGSGSLGTSSTAASNLVFNGGGLQFTTTAGASQSTNRLFTLGATTTTIENTGSSSLTLTFSNTGSIAFLGTGPRALTFISSGGTTTLAPLLGDGIGGATSLNSNTGTSQSNSVTLVLDNAANTYTGPTTLGAITNLTSKATLTANTIANGGVASSIGQSSAAASNLLIGNGRTFAVANSGSTNRLFTLNGTAAADFGTIQGTGLNFTNTGSLAYGVVNQTRTLQLQGGTSASASTFAPLLADNGTGALSLTIGNGASTYWNVTNANTYTGITTINTSTTTVPATLVVTSLANGLSMSNIGAATASASNLVFVPNGNAGDVPTLRYVGAGSSTNRLFTINSTKTNPIALDASGTGAVNFTGTGAILFTGTAGLAKFITLMGTSDASITNTFAPKLSDNLPGLTNVTKTGINVWNLTSSTSDYTGITAISSGVLAATFLTATSGAGNPSSIGSSANIAANLTLADGATFRYVGAAISTDRVFRLGGTNTALDASGTGAINFNNTATQDYGTTNQVRNFSLAGTNTGANTLAALLPNNGTFTVNISKNGGGTWNLTGTNSYKGTTLVNAGTLNINGDQTAATGAFTLAGTLGGIGTTGGNITVSSGGVLRGGIGNAGTLHIGGATTTLSIAAGGALGIVVSDGSTPSASQGGSTVGGTPNPSSNTYLERTNNTVPTFNPAGVVQVSLNWASYTPGVPYSFQVGSGFGTGAAGTIYGDANIQYLTGGAELGSSSLTRDTSGNIFLNLTPVPETSSILLAASAALAGAEFLRRRRRSGEGIISRPHPPIQAGVSHP